MVMEPFMFAGTPKIYFGPDTFLKTADIAGKLGSCVLVVTGGSSTKKYGSLEKLEKNLSGNKLSYCTVSICQEPTPEIITEITQTYKSKKIDAVIAVGGGSVIDAGKAISAMLVTNGLVTDYLESLGSKSPPGTKVPFIAVPTTSGTGSETTKNAVITSVSEFGFKKSLRHDNYMPDIAIVDPKLTLSLSPQITAHCGMDAFSQLLESYLSIKATHMTDALALSGIKHISEGLISASTTEPDNLEKRTSLSYAAMISGITLANAGLGIVHGIAGPIGGFFDIPHGLICGALLYEAMKTTIRKMLANKNSSHYLPYITKCAEVGSILNKKKYSDIYQGSDMLITLLQKWCFTLAIPKIGRYGVTQQEITKIVDASSNKNNPIKLDNDDIAQIVSNCI
jgi:alcohol dehydrogenase class IV